MDDDLKYIEHPTRKITLRQDAREQAWKTYPTLSRQEAEIEMAKALLKQSALRKAGLIQ